MTSNERKIINFLREMEGKTHIGLIAKKTNFSSDYTRSLCHSLARAGYIKLEDSNVCHLLKKGQGHFESVAVMREVSEPVVVTANVTLLGGETKIADAETELKSEPEEEEEKPAIAEAMADKEKELTEGVKAENPEKVVLKEESAKPSGGFGVSFKKFVNWFAEKK